MRGSLIWSLPTKLLNGSRRVLRAVYWTKQTSGYGPKNDACNVKQPWQAATCPWADGYGLGPLVGDRMDKRSGSRVDKGSAANAL